MVWLAGPLVGDCLNFHVFFSFMQADMPVQTQTEGTRHRPEIKRHRPEIKRHSETQ